MLESEDSKILLENSNVDATLDTNDDTMVTLVNGVTCTASPPAAVPLDGLKPIKIQTNLKFDLNEKCEIDLDKNDSSAAIQTIRNDQVHFINKDWLQKLII